MKANLTSHSCFFIVSVLVSALIISNKNSEAAYYFKYLITPFEVFLHEASHGIAALISGSEILELQMRWMSGHVKSIDPDGSNLNLAFVSFSGYSGTTIFGFMLFLSSIKYRRLFTFSIIAISIFFTFYYSDLETIFVMLYVMFVMFMCAFNHKIFDYILRFVGVYIMTTSVISPSHQLGYSGHSDSMNLQKILPLPEVVWVGIWMIFSLIVIFYSFKLVRVIDRQNFEYIEKSNQKVNQT